MPSLALLPQLTVHLFLLGAIRQQERPRTPTVLAMALRRSVEMALSADKHTPVVAVQADVSCRGRGEIVGEDVSRFIALIVCCPVWILPWEYRVSAGLTGGKWRVTSYYRCLAWAYGPPDALRSAPYGLWST